MERVEIRPATKADLPYVLELYSQPELDNGQVLPLEEAECIYDRIRSYPNYRIYVAHRGDEIVGTFSLLIMDNLAHMGARSGILEDIAVAPKWQVKGIGRQMMDYAMKRCQETECYKMVLSSNRKREATHQFYQRLGFEHHGFSFVVPISDE